MIPNRKCVICGKEYEYCPSCGKDKIKPSWMTLFDSDNCKNIYAICVNYRDGKYSVNEANEKLNKCDLSEIDQIENGTKLLINLIQDASKKNKKIIIEKEIEETKVEEDVVKEDTKEKRPNRK